jgi:hypothetical protein
VAQAVTLVGNLRRFLTGIGGPPEIQGPARIGSSVSPAGNDPEVTETSFPLPDGVGDNNAVYVGGAWYAINGPLVWALASLDGIVPDAAVMALDELERNTLKAHAEAYPEHWNGVVNVDDACWSFFSSDPGACGVGALILLGGSNYAGQITHKHAWTLFSLLKLAGVEPTRDGYRIAPRLPLDGWSLRFPNLGLAQDGATLRGYLKPAADGPIELYLQPRGVAAGARYAAWVDGVPVTLLPDPQGGVRIPLQGRAGQLTDWALRGLP